MILLVENPNREHILNGIRTAATNSASTLPRRGLDEDSYEEFKDAVADKIDQLVMGILDSEKT